MEAEILCRRALSMNRDDDLTLKATSALLLDQISRIREEKKIQFWNPLSPQFSLSSPSSYSSSQGRVKEVKDLLIHRMNLARKRRDMRIILMEICKDMLRLDFESELILSYVREAEKNGCDDLKSPSSKVLSRRGPAVTYSTSKPYSYSQCLSSFGSIFADLKRFEEAASYFDRSATSFHVEEHDTFKSGEEFYNAAAMYGEMKMWQESRVRFEKSLSMRPDLTTAYCYLGSINYMLNEHETGLKNFEICFDEGGEVDESGVFHHIRDLMIS